MIPIGGPAGGWYRKKVIIEKINRDKKIFIEFDGVQKYSQFWVNGHYVGEHQGGFNSFFIRYHTFCRI